MDGAEEINQMVDDCIAALVNDSPNVCAEILEHLARLWANAGLPIKTFLEVRQYIIGEASQKTSALFISEKLQFAESDRRLKRNGTAIIGS